MVSSHWYEAVIEKFGTVENFIDQLCELQGLTKEEPVSMIQERKKYLTVDELIKELKDIRKIVGGGSTVLMQDYHYAIEFDQDKILEDLLAKEVMIEYKGDTVTVDDIFASFK